MSGLGAIGGIIGGIGGMLGSGSDGMGDLQRAQQLIAQVKDPNFDFSSLQPEELKVLQQYAPEMYQKAQMASAAQVGTDPRLKQAQMMALQSMQDYGQSGGQDLQSQAALNNVKNQQEAQNRGQQEAIMNSLGARGQLGGGQEAAMRMMAQQGAANQAADSGLNTAADARARALQAMMHSGNMAGEMRGQDYQVDARNADTINNFNMANFRNTQDLMNQNTGLNNRAQLYNQQNQQDIYNQNVGNRNQAAVRNQNNFNSLQGNLANFQLQKAGGQAAQFDRMGDLQNARQAANAQRWTGAGQAIGQMGSSFGGGPSKMTVGKPQQQSAVNDEYDPNKEWA